MNSQELISIREYGRRRGVSDTAVRKWIRAGRITLVDGKVDPAAADLQVEANRTGAQASKLADSAPVFQLAPAAAPALPAEPTGHGTLAEVQRELAQTKVDKATIELQRLRGETIAVAEVEQAVGELISAAQSRLLLVPHKIADELARLADPIACRNVLEHAIREALSDLSRYEVAA